MSVTRTSSKGNRSWKTRLILAPPESSCVLTSVPAPSMLLSKSPANVVIILKHININQIPVPPTTRLNTHITHCLNAWQWEGACGSFGQISTSAVTHPLRRPPSLPTELSLGWPCTEQGPNFNILLPGSFVPRSTEYTRHVSSTLALHTHNGCTYGHLTGI